MIACMVVATRSVIVNGTPGTSTMPLTAVVLSSVGGTAAAPWRIVQPSGSVDTRVMKYPPSGSARSSSTSARISL